MAERERWGTRFGLILAMAGNAVGLGNFLRFPVQAAQNGGGAFMIPYFVCFILLGIPLMWIEWTIGRMGGRYGHSTTPGMMELLWKNPLAKYVGVAGLFMPFVIMVYYTYVESWSLGFALFTGAGSYWGASAFEPMQAFLHSYQGIPINSADPAVANAGITYFSGIAWAYVLFVITLLVNIYVLSRGVSKGIETIAKFAMPTLFLFAIILVVRVLFLGTPDPSIPENSVATGLGFIWNPVAEMLTDPGVWLAAAGQVFFTLSLGMGTIHCYAAYLRENDDVALTGLATGATNEFAEVVLGGTLAIPAAVAFYGLDRTQELATSAYDLAFAVMPALFQQIPMGQVFGTLWFALLFFAGITSSLAMGQPIMAFLQESFGMTRQRAAAVLGLGVFLFCQPVIFWNQQGFLNELDFWAGTFGLVVFATIETVLFAWVFGIQRGWEALNRGADIKVPIFFRYCMTFITPALLLVILGNWVIFNLPPVLRYEGFNPDYVPYVSMARWTMIAIFAGMCLAVWYAWRGRPEQSQEA